MKRENITKYSDNVGLTREESLAAGTWQLLDEQHAADMLNCSPALLRKWRYSAKGPTFVKIGRLVRYRQTDIDAFVSSRVILSDAA